MAVYGLRVGGELLDLPSGTSLVLNATILDFSDISKRGVATSSTVSVPLTAVNLRALGFPLPLNAVSGGLSRLRPASLLLGETVVSQGQARVSSVDIDERTAKIQYQDDGRELFDRLDTTAGNIDLSEFDYEFNETTYDALKNRTPGELWVWKDVSMAVGGTAADVGTSADLAYSRPLYNVAELVTRFAANAGYAAVLDPLLAGTELSRLLMSAAHDKFIVSDFRKRYEAVFVTDARIPLSGNDFDFVDSSESGDELTNPDYVFQLNVRGLVGGEPGAAVRIVTTFGAEVTEERIELAGDPRFVNLVTDEIPAGGFVYVEAVGTVVLEDAAVYLLIEEKSIAVVEDSWENPGPGSVLDGYRFLAAQNLPDLTQLDIVRAVWSLYFASVEALPLTKELVFGLLGVQTSEAAADLTDNALRGGGLAPAGVFARDNVFRWSNDPDTFPAFAQFDLRVRNELGEPRAVYLEVPFAASSNKDLSGVGTIARLEVYAKDFAAIDSEARVSLSPRLLLEQPGGDNAVFASLSWSYLFNTYYAPLLDRLGEQKRVEFEALLTYAQFVSLRMNPTVFVRSAGTFYVETARGFAKGAPTKLSTLKLT